MKPLENINSSLIKSIRQGDDSFAIRLYKDIHKDLYMYVYDLLGNASKNKEIAETITFQSYIDTLKKIKYIPDDNFKSYLLKNIEEKVISYTKENPMDKSMNMATIKKNVRDSFNDMPIINKQVIALWAYQKKSIDEISQILEISKDDIRDIVNSSIQNMTKDMSTINNSSMDSLDIQTNSIFPNEIPSIKESDLNKIKEIIDTYKNESINKIKAAPIQKEVPPLPTSKQTQETKSVSKDNNPNKKHTIFKSTKQKVIGILAIVAIVAGIGIYHHMQQSNFTTDPRAISDKYAIEEKTSDTDDNFVEQSGAYIFYGTMPVYENMDINSTQIYTMQQLNNENNNGSAVLITDLYHDDQDNWWAQMYEGYILLADKEYIYAEFLPSNLIDIAGNYDTAEEFNEACGNTNYREEQTNYEHYKFNFNDGDYPYVTGSCTGLLMYI